MEAVGRGVGWLTRELQGGEEVIIHLSAVSFVEWGSLDEVKGLCLWRRMIKVSFIMLSAPWIFPFLLSEGTFSLSSHPLLFLPLGELQWACLHLVAYRGCSLPYWRFSANVWLLLIVRSQGGCDPEAGQRSVLVSRVRRGLPLGSPEQTLRRGLVCVGIALRRCSWAAVKQGCALKVLTVGELRSGGRPQGCPHWSQWGWWFILHTCQSLGQGCRVKGFCGGRGHKFSGISGSSHERAKLVQSWKEP